MEKRWIANPNVKEVDFLDIRIEKTERAIKQAFMELRAEKPLEKIRVKELCDRACINKSTFYAHYQDIYALANAMEDEMVEAVVASLPNLTARDVSERTEWLAREMFHACFPAAVPSTAPEQMHLNTPVCVRFLLRQGAVHQPGGGGAAQVHCRERPRL